ncbi:MAG: UDP-N-acetylmuramoyl-tripeptide--D-alanyl-D-alanine ligase [Fusobacteriaceae bacterium]
MEKLFFLIKKYIKQKYNKNIIEKLDEKIGKIEMDSRKVEEGDIFFAINNGKKYIPEVLKRNPYLIITNSKEIEDEKIIFVENVVETMQELATLYRKEIGFKIIGITGSNGKTTTKDILFSILKEKFKTKKTEGNYNNHIGVPFTILTTPEDTEYIVLEMGMSNLGEIDLLGKISLPNYGVITNIGVSHLEILKSKENVFKAKTELLNHIKLENIFVTNDDEFLVKLKVNKSGFSKDEDNLKNFNYEIVSFQDSEEGIEMELSLNKISENYRIPLNGKYNAVNASLAIALAKKIGMSKNQIDEGLKKCVLTPMRFEKLNINETTYINDAYNASPVSMELGLETFSRLYKDNFKVAILGDMLELGSEEEKYHIEVIEKSQNLNYEFVILYGPRMEKAFTKIKNSNNIKIIQDKEKIAELILELIKENKNKNIISVVYLKGSRGMKLEEILNVISIK